MLPATAERKAGRRAAGRRRRGPRQRFPRPLDLAAICASARAVHEPEFRILEEIVRQARAAGRQALFLGPAGILEVTR